MRFRRKGALTYQRGVSPPATRPGGRPTVERSVAWLVVNGHRQVRFRGTDRNRMWLDHRVAAINLRQLIRRGFTSTNGAWATA